MLPENETKKVVWTAVGKRKRAPTLIGCRLNDTWLEGEANLTRFALIGGLSSSIRDLIDVARQKKLYLPIGSLRASLSLRLSDLIMVDRDLGFSNDSGASATTAAIELWKDPDGPAAAITSITKALSQWAIDVLLPWAERHDVGTLAERILPEILEVNIEASQTTRKYTNNGQVDLPLAIRHIAEQLQQTFDTGVIDPEAQSKVELFPGLGPCSIVISADKRENFLELSTKPFAMNGQLFSMIANLRLVHVPFIPEPLLKVSAMKRNWAQRAPKHKPNSPQRFKGYVFAPGDKCVPAWVIKTKEGWELADGYASILRDIQGDLPTEINAATLKTPFDPKKGWFGLPESTRLFNHIGQRTVFEADELELLDRVREIGGGLFGDPIGIIRHQLGRGAPKSHNAMLKPSDLGMEAQGIEEDLTDDIAAEDIDPGDSEPTIRLEQFREQNIAALRRLHGETKPIIWMFGGTPRAQGLAQTAVKALFGDAIETLRTEVLPLGTHGLRNSLEMENQPGQKRLTARAAAWTKAVGAIADQHGPKYALICASDAVGRTAEDPVNYYAGINALCSVGANVHHVLPIEDGEAHKAEVNFIHRLQSALLDMLFAHSGLVLGVDSFINRLFPERRPQWIYGIQIVRSNARSFTGEHDVVFIAFTRLDTITGITEVQYVHEKSRAPTAWMKLAEGLRWLGSNRSIAGSERWVRTTFASATKAWLNQIHKEDINALITIDWSTTKKLWPGIRDQDLLHGNSPRLDGIDLSEQFPGMSFVRVRRGVDTISLRAVTDCQYVGWKEEETREPNGEQIVDLYPTTAKSIVEIDTGGRHPRRGHFIVSMGYAQNAGPRGTSCYREMYRVVKLKQDGKATGVYIRRKMQPASKDTAVPASLDVTVLSCPNYAAPEEIAKAVMGLRLGYAHYGAWTSMPAPLFFERKISDYVIRYPDSDNKGVPEIVEEDTGDTSDAGNNNTETPMAKALVDEILPAAQTTFIALPPIREIASLSSHGVFSKKQHDPLAREQMPTASSIALLAKHLKSTQAPSIILSQTKSVEDVVQTSAPIPGTNELPSASDDDNPLLKSARDAPVIALYENHRQLYMAMMRGNAKVVVDLPYFATFDAMCNHSPPSRYEANRWWGGIRASGIVKHNMSMVSLSDFWLWNYNKLRIPQAAYELNSYIPSTPKVDLLSSVASRDLKVLERADLMSAIKKAPPKEARELLVDTVIKYGTDEEIAWMILRASMVPGYGYAQQVIQKMKVVPGPMTSAALDYYVRCANACDDAVMQYKNNRRSVDVRYPRINLAADDQQGHVIMLKQKIKILVDELDVGSATFESSLIQIEESFEELRKIHDTLNADRLIKIEESEASLATEKLLLEAVRLKEAEESERIELENRNNARLANLAVRVDELCNRATNLVPADEDLALINISPTSFTDINATETALSLVEEVFERYVSTNKALLAAMAASAQPGQRKIKLEQEQKAYATVEAARDAFNEIAQRSVDFIATRKTSSVEHSNAKETSLSTADSKQVVASNDVAHSGGDFAGTPSTLELMQVDAPLTASNDSQTFQDLNLTPSTASDDLINDDDTEEYPESSEVEEVAGNRLDIIGFKNALETVRDLMIGRHYELARINVQALAESMPDHFRSHQRILDAMFVALDRVDCQLDTNAPIPSDLATLIAEPNSLASGEFCDYRQAAIGILSAILSALTFGQQIDADGEALLTFVDTRVMDNPPFAALVETLWERRFEVTRTHLSMSRQSTQAAIESEIIRMRRRASNWLADSQINSTMNHVGIRRINNEIFHHDRPIGKLLRLIERGDITGVRSNINEALRKFEKPSVTIDEVTKKLSERGRAEGKYRQMLIENIETTEKFVNRFIELHTEDSETKRELQPHIRQYLGNLYKALQTAEKSIDLREIDSQLSIESLYMRGAKVVLAGVMRFFDENSVSPSISAIDQRLLVQLPMDRGLFPSFKGDNPLCSPSSVLEEISRLSKEVLKDERITTTAGVTKIMRDAGETHLTNGRFLPAFLIARLIGKDSGSGENSLLNQHRTAATKLNADLNSSRALVSRTLSISAITKQQADSMLALISEVSVGVTANPPTGHPDCPAGRFPDLLHARKELNEKVAQTIERSIVNQSLKLEREIAQFEEQNPNLESEIRRVREMLQEPNPTATRTAQDAFAVLKKHKRLPEADRSLRNVPDEYNKFLARSREVVASSAGGGRGWLEGLASSIRNLDKVTNPPEWLARMNPEDRDEAVNFISIWIGLCTLPQQANAAAAIDKLSVFFTSLGAANQPEIPGGNHIAKRIRFFWPDLPFYGLGGPDGFMPPDIGSQGHNLQGELLRGVAQEVDADIKQIASATGAAPTVILARTKLDLEQRAKLSQNSPVLLIDDYLVGYMAINRECRLRIFLDVALLTYNTRPYDDYNASPVPPEMFFGRRRELEMLRDVKSAAILYGGRRLGKSSLLDQIQRDQAALAGQSYAVYIPMTDVGNDPSPAYSAWKLIYSRLCDMNLVARKPTTPMTVKDITEWLQSQLMSGKNSVRSLYLLLDEADRLMESEVNRSTKQEEFVRPLQTLCETVQSKCRLRYVIAGLHNVTRMTTEENSPLGKAEAIALEPFNTPEDIKLGYDLITKPLAALGFFFPPEYVDLPWRILSVCNMYPAFIQLYCKCLLDRMYNMRQGQCPPTFITPTDLDAVEHDEHLLVELQRKFELNLNLDKRYKAIALILADIYYGQGDVEDREGLTPQQVREYCELYASSHFRDTGAGVYEALLDEMRRLNILERSGARYALRNQNIAMMMGSQDKVRHDLDNLADEKPETTRVSGERRPMIKTATSGKANRIFPMPAAWVRATLDNASTDGQLLILVGNRLSGLNSIIGSQDSFRLINDYQFVHKAFSAPRDIDSYLRKNACPPNTRRMIAVTQLSWTPNQLDEYAAAAEKAGKTHQARVVLIANQEQAVALAKMKIERMTSAEAKPLPFRIEPIPTWSEDAVFYHLGENVEISEKNANLATIIDTTCGFGERIENVCKHLGPDDVNKILQAARADMIPNATMFYSKIGWPASIDLQDRLAAEKFSISMNGISRDESEFYDLCVSESGVKPWLIQFMQWMGLLRIQNNQWTVPKLYQELLQS